MLPRLAAVLSTAALVGAGLVSAAPAQAAPDHGVSAKGKAYGKVLAVGKGKRKAVLAACTQPDGNYLRLDYKASIKRATDRTAPRFELGVGESFGAEFSLFPGGLTEKSYASPFSAGEVLTVTIRNLGKKKSASIAIGNLPGC